MPQLNELLHQAKEEKGLIAAKALALSEITDAQNIKGFNRVQAQGDRYYQRPADFLIEQGTMYKCFKCDETYYGGENDFDASVRENMDPENFLCQRCAQEELGYGSEWCEIHGNEFIDYKCMHCCSIALFVSEGGRQYDCEPCLHNALDGGRCNLTECTGGPNCPLGIHCHPKADNDVNKSKFPLGCSLCRSEKLSVIVRPTIHAGINLETIEEMNNKHGHFKGHDINREMKIVKGGQH